MRTLAQFLIGIYQTTISPFLGSNCRFEPSCSHYADECFKKFSFPRALWYSSRRICKCHPFHPGGYDPVP
ncbi:MAG: membrane protein insertion efficiency factor YidD [Bacteriovoracaceae bacterium]